MTLRNAQGEPVGVSEGTLGTLNCDIQDFPLQTSFLPAPSELPSATMSISALADHCSNEVNNYRRGEPSDEQYAMELFRRALQQRDSLAWEVVQQLFGETVLRWMRGHPLRKVACYFDSEENYRDQAFARFWLATAGKQETRFKTLAGALQYLRASLHGTILDTLRAYSRPQEVALPEPGAPGEPFANESDDSRELWEVIEGLLPNDRERRLAYLLFHCHLKPREIVHFCSDEFSEVQEVYRLRRNIFERLLRNADIIRWRLAPRTAGKERSFS